MTAWQWAGMKNISNENPALSGSSILCSPVTCCNVFTMQAYSLRLLSGAHMQDLTEQDNKAQFKGKWIRNRTYKINITVWRYRTRTGSQCNLGWTSLNGQSSVVVCRWQRWHISSRLGLSMVIFFQDRTQCAWFAALTQWLITIHSLHYSSYSLFSLLHNLILSLLSALSTNSLFLAHLPVALDDLQNILSTSGEFQLSVMRACAQYPVRE